MTKFSELKALQQVQPDYENFSHSKSQFRDPAHTAGRITLKTLVVLVICCGVFSACTSITVRRPDSNLAIKHVCIQENPKVWVRDFLTVLRDGFTRHGIATTIYSGTTKPTGCEFVLSYTALQSWDFAPYLSHAELRLEKDGRQIGYAEYHLIGKGGFSLMKWAGTKTKMDPVIDELLQNGSGATVEQQPENQKELPIIAEAKPTTVQQSESKSLSESKGSSAPVAFITKKFFADLTLYDGRIVGINQITRAEFVETANLSGTIRLIAPGNNVFSGVFYPAPTEDLKLTVLSSRTRNTIKLMNDSNVGILTANDGYGNRLECVYGTLVPTARAGGVCEDTQGNRYKLFFD